MSELRLKQLSIVLTVVKAAISFTLITKGSFKKGAYLLEE